MCSASDIDHRSELLFGLLEEPMLVSRPRDWGILDLHSFNEVLLGKWWRKFMTDPTCCGAEVVQFSYGVSRWNTLPRQTSKISFFLKEFLVVYRL